MVVCIILPHFRLIAEILQELEQWRSPSDQVQAYHKEKFKVLWNAQKLAKQTYFNSDLLHLTKFQADSWNPLRVEL